MKERRRVFQLLGSFERGGSEIQAVQLANVLHNEGTFEVFVGCLDRCGPLLNEIDWLANEEIPEFKLTSFYNLNFARMVSKCADHLRTNRIDLIHTHDFYTNIFGMLAAKYAGLPARIASKRETLSKSRAQFFVERQAFRLSKRIVVNADAVGRFLIERGVPERKLVTIYNGADNRRLEYDTGLSRAGRLRSLGVDTPEDSRVVAIVANMSSEVKNHKMFLRAAKTVRSKVANAVFVLAGEGDLTASLREFAGELGIGDACHFIGASKNIGTLLSVSDIGVLTSRSEGFSNAIIEYMAAGLPVVATDVGGAAEAVVQGETGYLVPSGDDTKLASRMLEFLENREMSQQFGQRGRAVAEERFSKANQLDSTVELYNSLLQESGKVHL